MELAPVPTLSVVIPSRNRHDVLAAALGCLASGSEMPDEVIIVDDASQPPLQEGVAALSLPFRCRVLRQESGSGAAAARNRGIREADSSDIVLMIDDDILVDRESVRYHRQLHRQHPENAFAVSGRVIFDPDMRRTVLLDYLEESGAFSWMAKRAEGELFRSGLISANVSMKSGFLRGRQLFDERFPYNRNEDTEFGLRMLRAGMRTRFSYAPSARHRSPLTLDGYIDVLQKSGWCKGFWALHMPDDTERCLMLERLLRQKALRRSVFESAAQAMAELGEGFAEMPFDSVAPATRIRFKTLAQRWFAHIEHEYQLRYWRQETPGFAAIEASLGGGEQQVKAYLSALEANPTFLPVALAASDVLCKSGRPAEAFAVLEPFAGVWVDLARARASHGMRDWARTEQLLHGILCATDDPSVCSARQRLDALPVLASMAEEGRLGRYGPEFVEALAGYEPQLRLLAASGTAEESLAAEAAYEAISTDPCIQAGLSAG